MASDQIAGFSKPPRHATVAPPPDLAKEGKGGPTPAAPARPLPTPAQVVPNKATTGTASQPADNKQESTAPKPDETIIDLDAAGNDFATKPPTKNNSRPKAQSGPKGHSSETEISKQYNFGVPGHLADALDKAAMAMEEFPNRLFVDLMSKHRSSLAGANSNAVQPLRRKRRRNPTKGTNVNLSMYLTQSESDTITQVAQETGTLNRSLAVTRILALEYSTTRNP